MAAIAVLTPLVNLIPKTRKKPRLRIKRLPPRKKPRLSKSLQTKKSRRSKRLRRRRL